MAKILFLVDLSHSTCGLNRYIDDFVLKEIKKFEKPHIFVAFGFTAEKFENPSQVSADLENFRENHGRGTHISECRSFVEPIEDSQLEKVIVLTDGVVNDKEHARVEFCKLLKTKLNSQEGTCEIYINVKKGCSYNTSLFNSLDAARVPHGFKKYEDNNLVINFTVDEALEKVKDTFGGDFIAYLQSDFPSEAEKKTMLYVFQQAYKNKNKLMLELFNKFCNSNVESPILSFNRNDSLEELLKKLNPQMSVATVDSFINFVKDYKFTASRKVNAKGILNFAGTGNKERNKEVVESVPVNLHLYRSKIDFTESEVKDLAKEFLNLDLMDQSAFRDHPQYLAEQLPPLVLEYSVTELSDNIIPYKREDGTYYFTQSIRSAFHVLAALVKCGRVIAPRGNGELCFVMNPVSEFDKEHNIKVTNYFFGELKQRRLFCAYLTKDRTALAKLSGINWKATFSKTAFKDIVIPGGVSQMAHLFLAAVAGLSTFPKLEDRDYWSSFKTTTLEVTGACEAYRFFEWVLDDYKTNKTELEFLKRCELLRAARIEQSMLTSNAMRLTLIALKKPQFVAHFPSPLCSEGFHFACKTAISACPVTEDDAKNLRSEYGEATADAIADVIASNFKPMYGNLDRLFDKEGCTFYIDKSKLCPYICDPCLEPETLLCDFSTCSEECFVNALESKSLVMCKRQGRGMRYLRSIVMKVALSWIRALSLDMDRKNTAAIGLLMLAKHKANPQGFFRDVWLTASVSELERVKKDPNGATLLNCRRALEVTVEAFFRAVHRQNLEGIFGPALLNVGEGITCCVCLEFVPIKKMLVVCKEGLHMICAKCNRQLVSRTCPLCRRSLAEVS